MPDRHRSSSDAAPERMETPRRETDAASVMVVKAVRAGRRVRPEVRPLPYVGVRDLETAIAVVEHPPGCQLGWNQLGSKMVKVPF